MKTLMLVVSAFWILSGAALAGTPDDQTWLIQTKHCGTAPLAISEGENLTFKAGFMAHVKVASDAETMRCLVANGYDRLANSTETKGAEYREASTLSTFGSRTVCRRKVAGTPTNPPVTDTTQRLPAVTSKIILTMTGTQLRAAWTGSEDCKNGVLDLDMTQK